MDKSSIHNEPMTLKKRRIYSEATTAPVQSALEPAKKFDDVDVIVEASLQQQGLKLDEGEFIPRQNTSHRRSWSTLARLALLALFGLVLTETALGLVEAWQQSPWLFGLYGTLIGVMGLWALTAVIHEWRKLQRLKGVKDHQVVAERLSNSMQMGEADKFVDALMVNMPATPGQQQYLVLSAQEHNDAEKIQLFDSLVLSELDATCRKIVRRYAAESALLLAASPLAVLDMIIILWRNQKMIQEVADCYGIELGYWSRIKLIRSIITNILYAGTSELVADLGSQLLSLEMTGKLSTRLAQGLGGGLLTARLGYQAMSLCRPIRFTKESRPKLSKIHQELLAELKLFTSKVTMPNIDIPEPVRNKDFT